MPHKELGRAGSLRNEAGVIRNYLISNAPVFLLSGSETCNQI